jgi:hypothetical protein
MTHMILDEAVKIVLCASVIIGSICIERLNRKVRNIERRLKDASVLPQTFDSSASP